MPTTPTGLSRRELWVDARDLQRGEETSPDRLTEAQYAAVLATRGRERLAENQLVRAFSAVVRTLDPSYQLGRDFLPGDRITVADPQLGVTADAVVTAARRAVSQEGESLELTLGYSQPTLHDILKAIPHNLCAVLPSPSTSAPSSAAGCASTKTPTACGSPCETARPRWRRGTSLSAGTG